MSVLAHRGYCQTEKGDHHNEHISVDKIDGAISIDYAKSLRFTFGDLEIRLAHPVIELRALLVHAVFLCMRLLS